MITEEGTPQQFKETLMNEPLQKCMVCGHAYMLAANTFEHPPICPRCKPHTYTTMTKDGGLACVSIDLSELPADMGHMTLGQVKARVIKEIAQELPPDMAIHHIQRVNDAPAVWTQVWPTEE